MRRPESHFHNHPGVRSGIFYFLIILCLLQGVKWVFSRGFPPWQVSEPKTESPLFQARLDSLRTALNSEKPWTLRPLDPNDLEDYRGYVLGIPFNALDSLYSFRSKGGRLLGMDQFKKITGLEDSTCQRLTPFFRFPKYNAPDAPSGNTFSRDLNTATADQLQSVRGIGPVLSKRIVRFREALGGFRIASQIEDVYGLSPETARRVITAFPLRSIPSLERIDLNRASAEELSRILYLNHKMARDIVDFRNRIGAYVHLDQLNHVESLPADKIDRIALYLRL